MIYLADGGENAVGYFYMFIPCVFAAAYRRDGGFDPGVYVRHDAHKGNAFRKTRCVPVAAFACGYGDNKLVLANSSAYLLKKLRHDLRLDRKHDDLGLFRRFDSGFAGYEPVAVAQGVGLALGAVISVDVVVFEFARGSHTCDNRRRHVAQTYESVLHDKSSFSFF